MQMLLDKGADVNTQMEGRKCWTPLLHAVNASRESVVQLLLDNGADANLKADEEGDVLSPLHSAAENGNTAIARMLLDRGADVRAMTRSGETPEDCASAAGHEEVAALLRAVASRRAQCEAFAMGLQKRLGVGSRVLGLHPEVVRMVLGRV